MRLVAPTHLSPRFQGFRPSYEIADPNPCINSSFQRDTSYPSTAMSDRTDDGH